MEELKKEALQTFLKQYRCLTNIELILDSIGITIERSFNDPDKEETIDYQLKMLFSYMSDYALTILDIDPHDEVSDVLLTLSNQYSYGDDSITVESILDEIKRNR